MAEYVIAPPPLTVAPVEGEAGGFPVRRILCVGRNYAAHRREMGGDDRDPPFFFAKPADALVPPGGDVAYPPRTANLHHEIELVIAIGGAGADVPVEGALALVYGYAVGVDLTRRDLQNAAKDKGHPWDASKGFDQSAPISAIRRWQGPPPQGRIALSVNGAVRQDATVADMIWRVAEIVSEASKLWALAPGDLIYTGTPEGVGPLVRGDVVEGEVEGVGKLDFPDRLMAMTLHSAWRATAPYRVRIGLALKGVAYDYAPVDLLAGEQREPAYRAVNPQGLTPALDLGDGQVLTQSLAILEWLEETRPQPPILPRSSLDRAIVRAMAGIIACDIHPLNNTRVGRRLTELGVPADVQVTDWIQVWIRDGFDALEPLVARHGGVFAFGDSPTLADCCLVPQVYSARRFRLDLAPWPALTAAADRAAERPAFQAAHPDRQPDAKVPLMPKTLDDLKAKNRAWAAGKVSVDPGFFKRLEGQQAPEYLWIGCSDSRVPANEIVGLDPGELFVHRNVANLAPPQDANYLSVLQFAVDVIKVKHVLVVGHYGCGGVAAAVDGQRRGLVDHWLHPIREVHHEHRHELEELPGEKAKWDRLVELNVIRQVRNVASDVFIREAWARGQPLSVHGWVYTLGDGLVTDLNVTVTGPDDLAEFID